MMMKPKKTSLPDNLSHNTIQWAIIIILSLFYIVIIISCVHFILHPNDNISNSLTTLASVVMAVCTGINVLIVSKQSQQLNRQVDEMTLQRKLQDRPFPWIGGGTVSLEAPRLWMSCGKECSYASRFQILLDLKNISHYPIPTVSISTCIMLKNKMILNGGSEYISGLAPSDASYHLSFLYTGDNADESIYSALREEDADDYAILFVEIVFQSLAGGCFKTHNRYWITPPNNTGDEKKLVYWQTEIANFNTKHMNEIKNVEYYADRHDKEKSRTIYSDLLKQVSKDINTEERISIPIREIPGNFTIDVISDNEYQKIISNSFYGRMVGKKAPCRKIKD